MNIALPTIQSGLHTSLSSLQWALNIYTITFAALTIPLGRLADNYGRNKIYLIGLGLFFIGSLASGSATNILMLIVGRCVQSIAAAIVFPASMTIGISLVHSNQRQTVILILGLTQGLAAAFGPVVGGILTQYAGWRSIFFINTPLLVIAIGLSFVLLPFKNEKRVKSLLDVPGLILIILTLFSLTLALVQAGTLGWINAETDALLCVFSLSLALFIRREMLANDPIIDLSLFKDRQFSGSVIVTVLAGIFFVALMVLMPSYFTKIQGASELQAALLVTPASFMVFMLSPIGGLLLKTVSPRLLIGFGLGLTSLAYIGLSLITPTIYWQFMLCCLLLGSGYGLIIGPVTVLSASDFTGQQLSSSQSVLGVFRQIGTVLAVAIFVSSLSGNLQTAKQALYQDAQTNVKKLRVTPHEQEAILTTTHRAIFQRQYSRPATTALSTAKCKQLAIKTAKRYAVNHRLGLAKKTVLLRVESATFHHLTHFNLALKQYQNSLQQSEKQHMTAAFLAPYKNALLFTILAIATIFVFKRKKYISID
ncbi:major facilitator superfamily permease [Secundilactobacillus kimchicus JCM 15530]|uniref:Major facilitator superfamily permease n=2 Tax=Secundilactobacillus kimchicus TaxID=528209 RepID=A0A0R1HZC5_9LACO|nr:major facilitator superfamily permease [Secundilactobacillus kimchicus JCM 15530]